MNLQIEPERKKVKETVLTCKKSLLVVALLSLAVFFVTSIIQNDFFSLMHFVYFAYPAILLLNVLPVFLIGGAVFFMTGRVWIGCLVAYIPTVVAAIANYYKVNFRDEPIKISDLMLLSELTNITQGYTFKLTLGIVVGVACAAALVVFAAKKIKTAKMKVWVRAVGALCCVCLMALSYNFIYTNKTIYDSIPTWNNEFHDADVVKHKGIVYSFLNSANFKKYGMPDGYSEEKVNEILKTSVSAEAKTDENINVFAIMGEAFFDVRTGGKVEFFGEQNPYKNYDRVKKEGYSGSIVVPGFGGSTESTEFEFLTGASQYLLDESMPTAYKTFVTEKTYGLTQYFVDRGYDAVAIHPGYGWFYNRKNAYKNLGFEKFVSRDDLPDGQPQINGYILDEVTTDLIIGNYEEHNRKNPQKPYFNFTVTIQNHGPYPAKDMGFGNILKQTDGMSDDMYHIINNYLKGIGDTDALLGEICDFASAQEKPIVILFFGDHLPYLDENDVGFELIGYDIKPQTYEGLQNKHTTPYVMWCNDSAKEIIKKNRGAVKRGKGPEISSGFLAAELLDYLGMEKSDYFRFVYDFKDRVNIITPYYYKSGETYFKKPDEEISSMIEDYKILQYYNFREYAKVDK